MRNDTHCWIKTLLRGTGTLAIGSAVMMLPDIATALFVLSTATLPRVSRDSALNRR
jgi:hypothetical protein